MQKMQGIEFNLTLTEEDKQIGFKQGYKIAVARHHTNYSGQIGVEDYGVAVDT